MIGKKVPVTTKRDLAKQVAASVKGIDTETAEKSISALLEAICRAVGAGRKVQLNRFGVFRPRYIREKTYHAGMNVKRTGESFRVPASVRFSFKSARGLNSLKIGDARLKSDANQR